MALIRQCKTEDFEEICSFHVNEPDSRKSEGEKMNEILFHVFRGIFFFFWILSHIFIWLFAAILTIFRLHTMEGFGLETYSKLFDESVTLIEKSDPLLQLIVILLFILIPALIRMNRRMEAFQQEMDRIYAKVKSNL